MNKEVEIKLKFKVTKALAIIVVFALITGCNMSKEEAIDMAKDTFAAGIKTDPQQPNQETESFNYFLPPVLDVEETNENNLILTRGNQIYLIFSNPAEGALSKVNYELDKAIEENPILIDTLNSKETFSYLIVSPYRDDEYKVIVGIGGEKGTTITDVRNFKESVKTIIEVIKSVSY